MSSTNGQADQHRHVVVLFADICDSSRLYRELGDELASAFVTELLRQLARIVGQHAGRVVDEIGDELMCSFPDSLAAIQSAIAMQGATRRFSKERPDAGDVAIRVGLHAGSGLEKDGRPVGDPVYIAKRLTDQAKAAQILLSEQSIVNDAPDGFEYRFVEEAKLKGQSEQTRIYEAIWDRADVTEIVQYDERGTGPLAVALDVLTPHHSRHSVADGESITIGRVAPAFLVIEYTTVSRLHARIDGRKGRFVLTDVSSNGTFVQYSTDKAPRFVRRDEIGLVGLGMIGLGGAPVPGAPNTLQYRCITADQRL